MSLHFPNPSRSFDESKNHVQFWGYDSAIEVSFYVGADALKRLNPDITNAEKGFLEVFDARRDIIHEVADKVYVRGGGGKGTYAYILAAEDFL